MATSKEYMRYITEQFSETDEITCRPMMGEYVLYYRGKVFGGIYDDRLLVKITKSSASKMPSAPRISPYSGAKEMLLVEETDDKLFLRDLAKAMYEDLPAPKKKKG